MPPTDDDISESRNFEPFAPLATPVYPGIGTGFDGPVLTGGVYEGGGVGGRKEGGNAGWDPPPPPPPLGGGGGPWGGGGTYVWIEFISPQYIYPPTPPLLGSA
jgi:hypothetical protein